MSKKIRVLLIIAITILLISMIFVIYKVNKKVILKNNYSSIECIDSDCSGVVAIKQNKNKNVVVELYDEELKQVSYYIDNTSTKSNTINVPYQIINKKYFISRTIKTEDYSTIKYIINDKYANEVYSTSSKLSKLTDNYVLKEDEESYSILSLNGKPVYSNIIEFNNYHNKYFEIYLKNNSIILDENMKEVLNGYTISECVEKDDKLLYFIVKDNNNNYYYYNGKIKGDSFISYKKVNDEEFSIVKSISSTNGKFLLKADGSQVNEEKDIQIIEDIDYVLYGDKYKVQKENNEYTLYINNEKAITSNYEIVVLNEKKTGNITGSQVLLYENDKLINDEKTLASVYDDIVVYSKDKVVTIYNIDSLKKGKYKLEDNERYYDIKNKKIFINNDEDKYIKILNTDGKQKKYIKNLTIKDIKTINKKTYIITKKDELYGLYYIK